MTEVEMVVTSAVLQSSTLSKDDRLVMHVPYLPVCNLRISPH